MKTKLKRLLTRTRIEALVVLLGVGGYIWGGLSLPPYYHVPGVPGPSVFPLILGCVMGGLALWLLIYPGEEKRRKEKEEDKDKGTSGEGYWSWKQLLSNWRFFLMWGLLIAYVFLLPVLGFPISSALLLAAFILLLGERHWYVAVAIAVVFTLGIYLIFTRGLQIHLPLGVLEGIFRW